jgi:hypothetical protein
MKTVLEDILTTQYKKEMISFLNSHPEYFDEAIELAMSEKQPYSWRAAWLLWSCIEENDHRIKVYVDKILNSLKTKQDGHQRELIKILSIMELNEEQEGHLFNLCMELWEKINKRPSVRYIAFKFIIKTALKHPDLCNEIRFLIQDHYMESLSPGIKRSITIMAKKIEKQQVNH